jgi:hypothetical protein
MSSSSSIGTAYRTWLDEDARSDSVLIASMEDRFAVNIVDFERTHQMWSFLHQKYECTKQTIYLVAIRQEKLLHQGDTTVEDLFISFLLFGISLTLLVLSCLLPLVSPAKIGQLHLSFIGPTTF